MSLTLPVVLACAAYYLFAALAGAMLPPLLGEERTWYGYWYRVAQTLAANSHRLPAMIPELALKLQASAAEPSAPSPALIPTLRSSSMISITTVQHAIASTAHEIVIGARAVERAVEKTLTVLQKDAPAIIALTSLVDPRAASIERIGTALLGEILPQIDSAAHATEADANAPSVTLTTELFAELKALAGQLSAEIAQARQTVAVTATKAL